MWKTLSLVLPVLIPSWRFFKSIEPSPRVQWALLTAPEALASDWHEFRPHARSESPLQIARRLLWNPRWNETLFVVSCAERIYHALPLPDVSAASPAIAERDAPQITTAAEQQIIDHSAAEIRARLLRDLARRQIDTAQHWLQFRLLFVQRSDTELREDVVFISSPKRATANHQTHAGRI